MGWAESGLGNIKGGAVCGERTAEVGLQLGESKQL